MNVCRGEDGVTPVKQGEKQPRASSLLLDIAETSTG